MKDRTKYNRRNIRKSLLNKLHLSKNQISKISIIKFLIIIEPLLNFYCKLKACHALKSVFRKEFTRINNRVKELMIME